jgi:glycosyltransferase involved in cell wall biosynthesis
MIIPVSVIIPTYNRVSSLKSTLNSFGKQIVQPQEIIVIDASDNELTKELCCDRKIEQLSSILLWHKAESKGAAVQRNQGFFESKNSFILFADDDIFLEPNCISLLWEAMFSESNIGGVNAMITNQRYVPLGRISNIIAALLSGKKLASYAGMCIPPVWAFLPDDNETLPKLVHVDWLNLGATLYRKEALPSPPFQKHFTGYSLMEDLTLSLIVGKKWKLYNVRKAKIFHDSQPGDYKSNVFNLSKMEFANRYYIMTTILEQRSLNAHFKFLIFQLFQVSSTLNGKQGWKNIFYVIAGKASGLWSILQKK